MVNKSLFSILSILSIFALIYTIREKWILSDFSEEFQEDVLVQDVLVQGDLLEDRSEENQLTLTQATYTEGLLEGQPYSFFGTGELASRNLSENQVKELILERISERDLKNYQNIEKNLVRTERWPYNKKWFIGELVIEQVCHFRSIIVKNGRSLNYSKSKSRLLFIIPTVHFYKPFNFGLLNRQFDT